MKPSISPEVPDKTQEISHDVSSTTSVPPVSEHRVIHSYSWVLGALLGFVVIAGLLVFYWQNISSSSSKMQQDSQYSQSILTDPQPTLPEYMNDQYQNDETTPQDNVIYLGSYQGQTAVFFTNQKVREEINTTNQSDGLLTIEDDSSITQFSFDHLELQNPNKIILPEQALISEITSFIVDTTTSTIYLSILLEMETAVPYPSNLINKIYSVDLNAQITKEVWSNTIGSDVYPGNGAVYLDQVIDQKIIIMYLSGCYACGQGSTLTQAIIFNALTGNDLYIESAGAFMVDTQNKSLTYREFIEEEQTCEDVSPMCNGGKTTVLKPEGTQHTVKLP